MRRSSFLSRPTPRSLIAIAIAIGLAWLGGCAIATDLDGYEGSTPMPEEAGTVQDSGGVVPPEDAGDGGASAEVHSCKDLVGKSGTDGPQTIDGRQVYCLMSVDNGGWTLVARTVQGAAGKFGWTVERGRIDNDEEPYSFGAAILEIGFVETLLVRRRVGKSLGPYQYKLGISSALLLQHRDSFFTRYAITTVGGDCRVAPRGPDMLRFAGFTDSEVLYYLRDFEEYSEQYGIRPGEMDSNYDNCERGANLLLQPVMLFVR